MTNDEVVQKFADQVRRSLDVERIKGFEFPEACDVGVAVLSSNPAGYTVKARMDNMTIEATIRTEAEAKDILDVVDRLVVNWLVVRATKKP